MSPLRQLTIVAIVCLGNLAVAEAAENDTNRPTAAFLSIDDWQPAALLEQRLLAEGRLSWVERNAIDKLLRERKLTSLLAPESVAQRSEIGGLLRADLLVLLSHQKEPVSNVLLVVCETKRGLRLVVHQVVLSQDVEDDVNRLFELAVKGIAQREQEIREVCAVPPFVSNDLTYEHDHLKAAYARLADQTIHNRPGLLTVELEEAQAIAREAVLSGEQTQRPLPLYLLGEYRHDGMGAEQTATLKIRAMRGAKELASREEKGLSAAASTAFVRRAVDELIEQAVGIRPLPPDSKVEAKQLAERAEVFLQLGAWEEAIAMAEASLLLAPDQSRMHEVAALALGTLATRERSGKGSDTMIRQMRFYFRAFEHFEPLLVEQIKRIEDERHTPEGAREYERMILNRADGGFGVNVDRADELRELRFRVHSCVDWGHWIIEARDKPEIQERVEEYQARELEILKRMTLASCRGQTGYGHQYLAWAVANRSLEERARLLIEIVQAIQDLPIAEEMTGRLISATFGLASLAEPEGQQCLEDMKALGNEAVTLMAVRFEARSQEYMASRPELANAKPPVDSPPSDQEALRFEPIQIGDSVRMGGLIPVGDGADLGWWGSPASLYLIEGPTKPEWLHGGIFIEGIAPRIEDVEYDGRFAWVAMTNPRTAPWLVVIDPESRRTWKLGADEGLPLVSPEGRIDAYTDPSLRIAPLEPGKVLLASWFGRLAIATVTFDPDKGANVDVFFEARHVRDATAEEPWRDPEMAFPPSWMLSLHGSDKQGDPLRKVLLGAADHDEYRRHDWPLVIDPDRKQIELVRQVLYTGIELNRTALTPDAIYRIRISSPEEWPKGGHTLRLERIGLPDLQPELVINGVPEGHLIRFGERFLVLGSRCWLLDPESTSGSQIRVIAARPPWKFTTGTAPGKTFAGDAAEPPDHLLPFSFQGVFHSNHFGIVVARYSREHKTELFQVKLRDE